MSCSAALPVRFNAHGSLAKRLACPETNPTLTLPSRRRAEAALWRAAKAERGTGLSVHIAAMHLARVKQRRQRAACILAAEAAIRGLGPGLPAIARQGPSSRFGGPRRGRGRCRHENIRETSTVRANADRARNAGPR